MWGVLCDGLFLDREQWLPEVIASCLATRACLGPESNRRSGFLCPNPAVNEPCSDVDRGRRMQAEAAAGSLQTTAWHRYYLLKGKLHSKDHRETHCILVSSRRDQTRPEPELHFKIFARTWRTPLMTRLLFFFAWTKQMRYNMLISTSEL